MGNQNSAHNSAASIVSLTTTTSRVSSLKPPLIRAMKSDISIHKSQKNQRYGDEDMFLDLKEMNEFNELKKLNAQKDNQSIKGLGIPTVFRWNGKGNEVFISGSFNNWGDKIPMKKSDKVYYTIINCEPGRHSFKFFVNGVWMHDEKQLTENNPFGTLNNWIQVAEDDCDIELALSYDEKHSKKSADGDYTENPESEYGQEIPRRPNPVTGMTVKNLQPRTLPPYLSETILNIEVAHHNDPALLKTPYHVQVNHMYASSISSGIAALSVTVRYRNKYITTLFYKPIRD